MIPASYDLTVYQGDTFSKTFRIRQLNADLTLGAYLNLTGYVGAAQVRTSPSANSVLATFTVTLEDQTSYTGGVTISLTSTITAGLAVTTSCVWDLQLTSPAGKVTTYVAGTFSVVAEVTR